MNILERIKAILQSSKIGHLEKLVATQQTIIDDLEEQLRNAKAERDEEIARLYQQKMRSNEALMAEIDAKNKLLKDLASGLAQVHKQAAELL